MSQQALKSKWGTYKVSNKYSGISIPVLEVYVRENLVRSSLVTRPGCKRGIRLIDLESLDAFIEKGIGAKVELEMNANRKGASAR
jgi:hypothetical protein